MAHLRLLFWFTNVHCGHCHVADSNVLLLDSWEDALICDIRGEGASFKAGMASFPSICVGDEVEGLSTDSEILHVPGIYSSQYRSSFTTML